LAGSRFKDRMVVGTHSARTALRALSKPGKSDTISDAAFNELKEAAPEALRQYLVSRGCKGKHCRRSEFPIDACSILTSLPRQVEYIEVKGSQAALQDDVPAGVKRLFYNISSESPACAYMPGVVHGEVRRLLADVQAATKVELDFAFTSLVRARRSCSPRKGRALDRNMLGPCTPQENAPVLADFFVCEWDADTGLLPPRAVQLLKCLLRVADACYQRAEPSKYGYAPQVGAAAQCVCIAVVRVRTRNVCPPAGRQHSKRRRRRRRRSSSSSRRISRAWKSCSSGPGATIQTCPRTDGCLRESFGQGDSSVPVSVFV
jgi:hypothetical protein